MKSYLQPPQNPEEFFPWLKTESEELWERWEKRELWDDERSIKERLREIMKGKRRQNDDRYGTKWLPGLTDNQIADYEKEMGFAFPEIYKMYLKCMNGTEEYVHTSR